MKKHRRKIGWAWKFENMHPVLKSAVLLGAGIATVGYVFVGSWLLYFMVTR